jgi:hypothetical protein
MGIHLAKEGTFAFFRHHLTKHVQFDGKILTMIRRIIILLTAHFLNG